MLQREKKSRTENKKVELEVLIYPKKCPRECHRNKIYVILYRFLNPNLIIKGKITGIIYCRYLSRVTKNKGLCLPYICGYNLKSCCCQYGEDAENDIIRYMFFFCIITGHLRNKINSNYSLNHVLFNCFTREDTSKIFKLIYFEGVGSLSFLIESV